MIATFVLIIGGRIIVGPDRGLMSRTAGLGARARHGRRRRPARPGDEAARRHRARPRREHQRLPRHRPHQHAQPRAWRSGRSATAAAPVAVLIAAGAGRCCSATSRCNAARAWLWLPVGLLLGGALGNLADRARGGGVIDFIDPILWPVFNLADAAIVVGRVRAALRRRPPGRGGMSAERFVATADEAGLRLDAALAARGLAAVARRRPAADRRRAGDGRRRRPAEVAPARGGGDRRRSPTRRSPAPLPEPPEVAVAYEDEHLLVVDKPAGLVVHPGAGPPRPTLVEALAGRGAGGPDPRRPGIVHRLDRDTSGLLVVARSDDGARGRSRTCSGGARSRASTWRSSPGRPDARTRHDRRPDRARPREPDGHVDPHRQAARRGDPLHGRRGAPAHDIADRPSNTSVEPGQHHLLIEQSFKDIH